jgi:hypothetical protein
MNSITVELKHHYGWKSYRVHAVSITDAAKSAVRQSHGFLTDDNHTMEVDDDCIVVRRTRDAEPPSITPMWAIPSFSAGEVWFSTQFREALSTGEDVTP